MPQVGHVSIECGNKKLAVLMLCKQWNHLIWGQVTRKHMIITLLQRIVEVELTKFAFIEVIFSSKSHQYVDKG